MEFSFAFPRKVIFGPNSTKKVSDEIARLASLHASVLLVTDKTIAKIGLSNRVIAPLRERGYEVDVYSEISGEPALATAEAVSQYVRDHQFDIVVGLGGGSCMDMAKVGALAATNPKPIKEYIAFLEDRVENKTLPKILIPTTAGTGSEATSYAVVVEQASKNFITSSSIVADVSVIDPALMASCPPKQTAGSGLDALSQCIEPYLSKTSDIFSDTFAVRGMQLISRNLKAAYQEGDDLEARSSMALGAFYGGISITTAAGVILGHCISETIGPRFKIPHGLACGIVLPYIVKFNIPAATDRIASLLHYLSDERVTGTEAKANRVVQILRDLLKELDVSSALRDYGVTEADALGVAKFIASEQQKNYALPDLNPRPINESDMVTLFKEMWRGEI